MISAEFPLAIVSFLDILGFSTMVEYDSANYWEPKYLHKIVEVLGLINSVCVEGITVSQFSDSIVLSVPWHSGGVKQMIELCAELQYQFAIRGVLLRGAISFGRHYVSDTIVYSSGLVKAYRLEANAARFPRIVVDANLVSLLEGTTSSTHLEALAGLLLVDEDGRVFVNYLSQRDPVRHSSALSAMLTDAPTDPGVLEKLRWLVKYHNFVSEVPVVFPTRWFRGIQHWRPRVASER